MPDRNLSQRSTRDVFSGNTVDSNFAGPSLSYRKIFTEIFLTDAATDFAPLIPLPAVISFGFPPCVYIVLICVSALDVHWEIISLSFFGVLQLFYFVTTSNKTWWRPYPSLFVAEAIIIWKLKTLSIVLLSVAFLFHILSFRNLVGTAVGTAFR